LTDLGHQDLLPSTRAWMVRRGGGWRPGAGRSGSARWQMRSVLPHGPLQEMSGAACYLPENRQIWRSGPRRARTLAVWFDLRIAIV